MTQTVCTLNGSAIVRKSNQGNRGYSGNQKNVISGQRPDIENRHTQQSNKSK